MFREVKGQILSRKIGENERNRIIPQEENDLEAKD